MITPASVKAYEAGRKYRSELRNENEGIEMRNRKREIAAQELAESVRRFVNERTIVLVRQGLGIADASEELEYERMLGALAVYEDIP